MAELVQGGGGGGWRLESMPTWSSVRMAHYLKVLFPSRQYIFLRDVRKTK
jgi:hypothetical protein